jgi:cation diffusion facilitator CzcD-associated flavoprotein CzcO
MAESFDIAIIGGGISGLGMAISLQQAGITDFVVLERADEVGGTWQANTYPGCACDVPSNLYSYSFAPNPDWSRTYSRQPEIWDYVRGVADRFGVRRYLRLGVEVSSADWDEDAGRWRLTTSQGDIDARVLVSAVGLLTEPKIPDVKGLDAFEGAVFHSARWNHDFDLEGKRVAAIGTGASAIQFVPEIQPRVGQLHVFQRTPPWVLPHTARPTSERERSLFRRVPLLQRLVRGFVYTAREALVIAFVKRPRLMSLPERQARRHIEGQLSDPELIAKVTPDYSLGCKRILPSDDWYPALQQPNVELVTDAITEIRKSSIVTADGTEREVDAIVLGTGFHVTDPPLGALVHGRGGRSLNDVWQGSMRAHLGCTVAGFPNLFVLLGPNTGLGHSSMVYVAESQVAYVMSALDTMTRHGVGVVEVTERAQAKSNADIDRRMRTTIWSTGCHSWYIDANGRNSALWPDWTWRFRRRTSRFDADSYRVVK